MKLPSQVAGVILFIATEIEEGEKVPPERLITVQADGEKKKIPSIAKSDRVKGCQLLARLDDRLGAG